MSDSKNPLGEYGSIGFFGVGSSTLSLAQLLSDSQSVTLRSDCEIKRDALPYRLRGARIFDCENALDSIDEELLVLSPSVRRDRPKLRYARERGVRMTSDLELFTENIRAPLVCVSGSDGKSTTATLTHAILKRSGRESVLTGNVGIPMYPSLSDSAEVYVAELSSFMLQYSVPSCEYAYVTNINENHLDWHKDFGEYKTAKLSLLHAADKRVVNLDDPILEAFAKGAYAVLSLVRDDRDMAGYGAVLRLGYRRGITLNGELIIDEDKLRGWQSYNIQNLMAGVALASGYSTNDGILGAVEDFKGLSHRAELVRLANGVRYVDSSIDTTPTRTSSTIRAIGGSIVLILGGKSKGLPYEPMLDAVGDKVRHAVITGESAEKIHAAIKDRTECTVIADFQDAIEYAASIARPGECVLLSPAEASYDRFKDYRERGDLFKSIVNKLKF